MENTAYIFEDAGGWYICDDSGPLDCRGRSYRSKRAAIAALRGNAEDYPDDGYRYYTTGDLEGRRVPIRSSRGGK